MNDLMIDLETLDTKPTAVILSIGATFFDRGSLKLGENFHRVISAESCRLQGLTVSADTLAFWAKQGPEARITFEAAHAPEASPLGVSLSDFSAWLCKHADCAKVRVWGNGSDFDNAILSNAYAACGIAQPWRYWNNRCYRTMKDMLFLHRPQIPARKGVHHNALDDAIYQAEVLMAYLGA